MNVLFLTMVNITSIHERNIYTDLLRKFHDEGHVVYIVTPCERRNGKPTRLYKTNGVKILSVKTLNVQKTSILEKGIGQILIEYLYKRAINKYFKDINFDLIIYSTPPITLLGVVKELKFQNPKAITYLLLKDIFPQNALDLGMMTTKGVKGLFYKYFRKQEINLYIISDYIGCMSPANVEYLLEHNLFIDKKKVEVAPNSIELTCETNEGESIKRRYIRDKYKLPTNKPLFIYGGNLGMPQDIPFLIKCLDEIKHRQDCHFVIVGTGTFWPMLQDWYDNNKDCNVTVMKGLPKEDYDCLVGSCDVGLIFLDHRFTIPNYPSRLLSYLENKMPIICATDKHCDMGSIARDNGYGYWCESVNPKDFVALVNKILMSDMKAMGEKGYLFLKENYLVKHTYNAIIKHV